MDPYDDFTDQAQIDPQLDLENHVWDITPYFNTFVGRSAETLRLLDHQADIPVGARDEERIDVFPAQKKKARRLSSSFTAAGGGWALASCSTSA